MLKIYHIEGRRSAAVVWLCEELSIPYGLLFKPGDLMASMQMIRAASPLMPMAPTVEYDGQVLVETGGIIDFLLAKHGKGRLIPAADSPDLALHFQWMHFAEGTAMARIQGESMARLFYGVKKLRRGYMPGREGLRMVGPEAIMAFIEEFLGKHPYFGGVEFSAADIMMLTPIRGAKMATGLDSANYPHMAAWRKKVEARPAFRRAMSASVPGGHNEHGLPKDQPLPFPIGEFED